MESDPPTPLTDTAFCLACGYSLKNLPANRCPECGREFDPADPRTMSMGRPLRRWQRWLLKPIGWPTIILALLGTAGLVYLGHRPHLWPEPWSVMRDEFQWPGKDLRPFTKPDLVFYVSVVLWLPFLALFAIRRLGRPLVPRVARRANPHGPRPERHRWIVAVAFLLNGFCIVYCWQQRVGQRWMAHAVTPASTVGPPPSRGYRSRILSAQPLLLPGLSPEETRVVFGNLMADLPDVNGRMQAMRLLVEDVGRAALPALVTASQTEHDPALLVWELRLIGLCRDPATASLLISRLQDSRPEVRAAAADAVGILRHPTYPIRVPNDAWIVDSLHLDSKPAIVVGTVVSTLARYPIASRYNAHDLIDDPSVAMPPEVRPILQKMMIDGPTTEEREAAARAMVDWPPERYTFRVAEWGVWMDNKGHLALTKSIMDEIPPFVHRTGNSLQSFDDYFMDYGGAIFKPIIHITSDVPLAADIEVRISQGRPWLAYPLTDDFGIGQIADNHDAQILGMTDGGQFIRDRAKDLETRGKPLPADWWGTTQPTADDFNAPPIKPLGDCREGYPWLVPHHRLYEPDGFGFKPGEIYSLGLRWQSLIVSPAQLPWMIPPTVPNDPRFRWWARLREVPSDWVANRGEAERFLYYDGPTHSQVPVTARLDASGNHLSLTANPVENAGMERIRWVPKFDRVSSTPRENLAPHVGLYIDVRHGISRGQYIPIDDKGTVALQNDLPLKGPALIQRFREMLLAYGLTAPEAEGLIASWTPQFFQTEGRRFILRMSPADYDRQCPMQVRPKPTEIVRLGLVLTEFDPPAGKSQLPQMKTDEHR